MPKLVVATEKGYHDGRRIAPGTEFMVPDKLKGRWFMPVRRPPTRGQASGEAPSGKQPPAGGKQPDDGKQPPDGNDGQTDAPLA